MAYWAFGRQPSYTGQPHRNPALPSYCVAHVGGVISHWARVVGDSTGRRVCQRLQMSEGESMRMARLVMVLWPRFRLGYLKGEVDVALTQGDWLRVLVVEGSFDKADATSLVGQDHGLLLGSIETTDT